MALRQQHHLSDLYEFMRDIRDQGEISDEIYAELHSYLDFLKTYRFDREAINRRLQLYAVGDERWREQEDDLL